MYSLRNARLCRLKACLDAEAQDMPVGEAARNRMSCKESSSPRDELYQKHLMIASTKELRSWEVGQCLSLRLGDKVDVVDVERRALDALDSRSRACNLMTSLRPARSRSWAEHGTLGETDRGSEE